MSAREPSHKRKFRKALQMGNEGTVQGMNELLAHDLIQRKVEEQNRLVVEWIEGDRKKTEASKRWYELHCQIETLKAMHK
jgi:hypothetical protein